MESTVKGNQSTAVKYTFKKFFINIFSEPIHMYLSLVARETEHLAKVGSMNCCELSQRAKRHPDPI